MSLDISLVVTFHSERLLAATTLASLARCLASATKAGYRCELVCVLDRIDSQTDATVRRHAPLGTVFVDADVGDPGGARNVGIAQAKGRYLGVADGDDYYSRDWLVAAVRFLDGKGDGRSIARPEYVVSFGAIEDFVEQIDQSDPLFSDSALITTNFWSCTSFALRETYLDVPYRVNLSKATAFGYEDWHWNCETVARGYTHHPVPRTVHFYRRKADGVLFRELGDNALIGPTSLFGGGSALPSGAARRR